METQVVPVEAEKLPGDYHLGPEDILFVSVWGEEDLTLEVTIRPDGKLSMPLIPDLEAEGLTALELRDEITTRL
ncbi:MAG: polysaccharide biosynthesis/export family protein, partial [Candidatus Binatia bacterium]